MHDAQWPCPERGESSGGVLAGIFVGGRSSRMGGGAKGLLVAPSGEPIVMRTKRMFDELGIECVLVGAHPAYAFVGLEIVADDPCATGPLAGILALLERAAGRPVIVVACDMPYLDARLVRRLAEAKLRAPVIAPRRRATEKNRDVWEPLFARYDASILTAARRFASEGGRTLQRLLDDVGARPFEMTEDEAATMTDWDVPADVVHRVERNA